MKYCKIIAAVSMLGALLALILPGLAGADSAVLAPDAPASGSDPAHNSPLEVLASSVASQIAGRPVRAICDTEGEWQTHGVPEGIWGFVPGDVRYSGDSGLFVDSAPVTFFAPIVCSHLFEFAKANVKPTSCAVTKTILEKVRVPYRKRVRYVVSKAVRRHGHLVTKRLTRYRYVTRYKTEIKSADRPYGLCSLQHVARRRRRC